MALRVFGREAGASRRPSGGPLATAGLEESGLEGPPGPPRRVASLLGGRPEWLEGPCVRLCLLRALADNRSGSQ